MKNILLIILLFLIPSNTFSEAPPEYKVHDEDVQVGGALSSLDKIESTLKEFRDMTDLFLNDNILYTIDKKGIAQIEIRQDDIKKFKMVDWDIQNLGFHNWIVYTRAYLLKSNYRINKFEYELAKCNKNVSQEKLKQIKSELDKAQEMYKAFLSRVTYAD